MGQVVGYANIFIKIVYAEKHQKCTQKKIDIALFFAFASLNMEMLKAV